MAPNNRSRLADIKAIGAIITATMAIAGLIYGSGSFLISLQTKAEAKVEHAVIEEKMTAGDSRVEEKASRNSDKVNAIKDELQAVGRNVKAIKCLMLAKNSKAKERCGLE